MKITFCSLTAAVALSGFSAPVELYPISQVRLSKTDVLAPAVKAGVSYVKELDADRLLAPFRREAGLPAKAKAYGNWESCGLDGHTLGHYLSALANFIAAGEDADGELKRRLDYILGELAACQAAHGDGRLDGVPHGKEIWASIRAGDVDVIFKHWVPWYNVHKTMAGLRDAFELAGLPQAKELLVRLCDWSIDGTSRLDDGKMQRMLDQEYGGVNETLADVYALTGDKKYLAAAKRWEHKRVFDPLYRHEDRLTGFHANTQIPKFAGLARTAQLADDAARWDAADFAWRTIVTRRTVAFGGNSVGEHFHDLNSFAKLMADRQGPETCNTYNMLRLTERLFEHEPKAEYAAFYERALYNHLLPSVNAEKPGFVYFTPTRPAHYRVYSTPQNCFWCCVGTGMENPGRYGRFVYAHRGDDTIYVNLFVDSELKGILRQTTDFPDSGKTTITFLRPFSGTVYIREGARYAKHAGTWKKGAKLTASRPMDYHVEMLPDGSEWGAVMRGPIVMGKRCGTDNLLGLFANDGRMSHVAYGPYADEDKVEYRDAGKPLDTTGLEPFYKLHECRYQIYWKFRTSEKKAVRADVSWQKTPTGIRVTYGGTVRTLAFYGDKALRVKSDLGADHWKHPSLAVIAKEGGAKFSIAESAETVDLVGPAFTARVSKADGSIVFVDKAGKTLLREAAQPVEIKEVTIDGEPTYEVTQRWLPADGEGLYGLGQASCRKLNLRGERVLLAQTNIPAFSPVFSSSKGWLVLWDVYSQTVFHDRKDGLSLWSESAPGGSDYYFCFGAEPDDKFAAYRHLTGAATMFPKAALGYFQSKERYKSQQELIDVVSKFRAVHYPLDYIVQDWQYWDPAHEHWNAMVWDPKRYPDPKALCRTLHDDLHVKLMNSTWPDVGDDTDVARELDAHGLRFLRGPNGEDVGHWISKGHSHVYDAYSPLGRTIYFKHLKRGLIDVGVDAMWMDGSELETRDACHGGDQMVKNIKACGRNAMGDFTRYLNTYGLVTVKGNYEGQRATSNRRTFTLTRSAWAGLQRYAAIPWSGDTGASWKRLREEVAAGLLASMSGLPYWTQDTGGFFCGGMAKDMTNPQYLELLARWNQFAIFNPIYRWHSSGMAKEPWRVMETFPDCYASYKAAAELRYRLIPYAYALMRETHETGKPLMRPVVLDYPETEKAVDRCDAFTFGPALFSQVVLEPWTYGRASVPAADGVVKVALPKGADWYDFWTNKKHGSAETVTEPLTLERFPLYVKAGSILPLGPAVEWATQKSDAPTELRVYAGADAAFTLYEDDNETYDYEKGAFVKIPLRWSEQARTLTIDAANGSFPGFVADRLFKVVLVEPTGCDSKTVRWTGKRMSVVFE